MRLTSLLAILAVLGCDALELEPERRVASLQIEPTDVLILEGDEIELTLVARDQNGEVIEIPEWRNPLWENRTPDIIRTVQNRVRAVSNGQGQINAHLAGVTTTGYIYVNPLWDVTATAAYITQAAQNPKNPLPLVAGRKGLLRIFVTQDEFHRYKPPAIRVSLFNGRPVMDTVLTQPDQIIPPELDESNLNLSYDLLVPGELVIPGLSAQITYDPEDEQRGIGGEEVIEFEVYKLYHFVQRLVPVISTADRSRDPTEWVVAQNDSSPDMQMSKWALPISDRTIIHSEPFITDLDPGGSTANFQDWIDLLRELYVLKWNARTRDYFYGVVETAYTYGVVGIALPRVGISTGIADPETHAHELGHNWYLAHAPCGNPMPSGISEDYPYEDGSIGRWGWNPMTMELMDPGTYTDLMGYCRTQWISWFNFEWALDYRIWKTANLEPPPASATDVLYIWGGIDEEGQIEMDPTFLLHGPVTTSKPEGDLLAEGFGPNGELVFSHQFSSLEISHSDFRGFAAAIPYDPSWPEITAITVYGSGFSRTQSMDSQEPVAMEFDPATNALTRIRRNWDGRASGNAKLLYSTGLPEKVMRR